MGLLDGVSSPAMNSPGLSSDVLSPSKYRCRGGRPGRLFAPSWSSCSDDMCEVAITLRADLDTICCMKGKISAAKTGTSSRIKNSEYLSGRCVGNDEKGYA